MDMNNIRPLNVESAARVNKRPQTKSTNVRFGLFVGPVMEKIFFTLLAKVVVVIDFDFFSLSLL